MLPSLNGVKTKFVVAGTGLGSGVQVPFSMHAPLGLLFDRILPVVLILSPFTGGKYTTSSSLERPLVRVPGGVKRRNKSDWPLLPTALLIEHPQLHVPLIFHRF